MRLFALLALLFLAGCVSRPASGDRVIVQRSADAAMLASAWRRSTSTATFSVLPTGSMRPALDENCLVLCLAFDGGNASPGDIVVYDSPRGPIVHRLLAINARAFLPAGDANNRDDGWLPLSSLRWVVVAIVRKG